MFWRIFGGVLAVVLLAALGDVEPVTQPPSRTLDCAAVLNAGAVACEIAESFISPAHFPVTSRFTWPPEGYVLRDRALLVELRDGEFCVVPIRALQRARDALYGELIEQLPPLHDGFAQCEARDVLQVNDPDYHTIVRMLRQTLPPPNLVVEPSGNTIVGIPTRVDWQMRPQPFVATQSVDLVNGPALVTIDASVMSYLYWTLDGSTTGPHGNGFGAVNPEFVYRTSGDEQIYVIDVWTVQVTAQGVRPFHEVVYVVHAPVNVRVHELVIRANPPNLRLGVRAREGS